MARALSLETVVGCWNFACRTSESVRGGGEVMHQCGREGMDACDDGRRGGYVRIGAWFGGSRRGTEAEEKSDLGGDQENHRQKGGERERAFPFDTIEPCQRRHARGWKLLNAIRTTRDPIAVLSVNVASHGRPSSLGEGHAIDGPITSGHKHSSQNHKAILKRRRMCCFVWVLLGS